MPLSALRSSLSGLDPAARVGVAVSGGGDSVAALVLAVEALGADRVEAATVDHGLRPEAADEAQAVAALCVSLKVRHQVLGWQGAGAPGNLMHAARGARLRLLARWARARVLAAVILGHTQDDQAETVLMRLARGSGVDGLAGMAAERRAQGVVWLRPFLGVTRAALRAELQARGVGWVEDPTNSDDRFARTRARAALVALAPLGIDAAGLVATAMRMARARAALEGQQAQAQATMVRQDRGTLVLDAAALDLPGEIRDRLVAGLIGHLSGAPYRPRLAALHRVLDSMSAPGGVATLSGVALGRDGGIVRLWREAAAVAGLRVPVAAGWDGRWRATGPALEGAQIAALGQDGLTRLSRQARAGLHPHWRATGLPAAALAGLPAIWRDDDLVAAPLVFWPQGWALDARPLAADAGSEGESD